MKLYDIDTLKYKDIEYPDIFFTPEYGKLCEISDSGIWKCIIDASGKLLIPFIEKEFSVGKNNVKHLVSNYGYGGFYNAPDYTLDYNKLNNIITNNSYISHFIRFTPYFYNNIIDLSIFFDKSTIILKGKTYGIDFTLSNYNDYLKNTRKNHRRSLKKSQDKCIFILRNISSTDILEDSDFRQIYKETMDRVESSKYYYFNNEYFKTMFNLLKNNILIAEIKWTDTNEIISSAIIFKWKNDYLHYHLGGSKTEYLKYAPNNKLHNGIIKYGFDNNFKLYHLGGGVYNNDKLDKYKKSYSNSDFLYYQGKIIYNPTKFDYFVSEHKKLNNNNNSNGNNKIFPVYING